MSNPVTPLNLLAPQDMHVIGRRCRQAFPLMKQANGFEDLLAQLDAVEGTPVLKLNRPV